MAAYISCSVPPLASIAEVTILRISAKNATEGDVITASGSGPAESQMPWIATVRGALKPAL
jgi:hypothetical protein